MRNRLHGEADVLRVVVAAAAAAGAATLVAAFAPVWLTLAVLALAAPFVVKQLVRRRAPAVSIRSAPPHTGPADETRVLVVADDALEHETLTDEIERLRLMLGVRVLVVVPLANSSGHLWGSNVREARAAAQARLDRALARLGSGETEGVVVDAEPLQAIEDVLAVHGADEIVVATQRHRPWEGLEPWLPGLVRRRFALPVAHFVVDA